MKIYSDHREPLGKDVTDQSNSNPTQEERI